MSLDWNLIWKILQVVALLIIAREIDKRIRKRKKQVFKLMKKLLWILVLGLLLSTSAYTDDIKDFQIEEISIGDSALNYFSETQLEDNELDWHNFSYKEYSTSLLPGKGIYDWFQISY